MLDAKNAKYTVVELDTDPDGKAIRAEMADRTVVMSIADIDAARACDHVISVGSDGTTKEGAPASMLESA